MSFCPISAALFFGSLLPLSVKHGSRLLLPSLFGLGTGLPVAVMAIALAAGGQVLARSLRRIGSFESVARRATGVVFSLHHVHVWKAGPGQLLLTGHVAVGRWEAPEAPSDSIAGRGNDRRI